MHWWMGSERYPHGHTCVAHSLLFTISFDMSAKVSHKTYPVRLLTIGDHIRKIRLDRGLGHKHVAEAIRATAGSVNSWEVGRAEPEVRYIPAIIKFLGYNPRSMPSDTLEQLRWFKWTHGMSLERLGKAMRRDPEQLAGWLSGRIRPFKKSLDMMESFLSSQNGS